MVTSRAFKIVLALALLQGDQLALKNFCRAAGRRTPVWAKNPFKASFGVDFAVALGRARGVVTIDARTCAVPNI